jgi:hypothetical protein
MATQAEWRDRIFDAYGVETRSPPAERGELTPLVVAILGDLDAKPSWLSGAEQGLVNEAVDATCRAGADDLLDDARRDGISSENVDTCAVEAILGKVDSRQVERALKISGDRDRCELVAPVIIPIWMKLRQHLEEHYPLDAQRPSSVPPLASQPEQP